MEYEGLARVMVEYIKTKGEKTANEWITNAAKLAKQISLLKATHVLKFHHSSATGSSVNSSGIGAVNDSCYLDTASLKDITFDVAIDNATALGAAGFLLCEFNGESLASALTRGDYSALAIFARDKLQLEEWVCGFKLALADKALESHTLAKQIYFPVDGHQYHLLSPLFSSSMAQALHKRISNSRSKKSKTDQGVTKESKSHMTPDVTYPNKAIMVFGGSNKQNVSQLNSGRGGKSFLLSSAPPSWKSELKPPVNSKSIFSGEYDRRARYQARNLQHYLLSIRKRDGNMPMRQQIGAYLDELIDTLFNYAAEVQNLTSFAGWSKNSNLKREQQLWLDPYHNDQQFQQERAKGDWQERIADDFAFWLKRKLKHELLVFGEVEHQEWLRLLNRRLHEFEADLQEVSI